MTVRGASGVLVVLMLVLGSAGCGLEVVSGENPDRPGAVRVRGRVERSGMTSYMYGTHVIVDRSGGRHFALRSETIDLDAYVGKRVRLTGSRVDGYPVDGGPPYLTVHTIRPAGQRGGSDE